MIWPFNSDPTPSKSPETSFKWATSSDTTSSPFATSEDPVSKEQAIQQKIDQSIVPLHEEMSAREAFDLAAKCMGIAGRFRYNYQHGGLGSCTQQWQDFYFAMRMSSKPDDVKRAHIKDRYRDKEVAFLSGPNSEDVWQERDKLIEKEKFFFLDPDETGQFALPRLVNLPK